MTSRFHILVIVAIAFGLRASVSAANDGVPLEGPLALPTMGSHLVVSVVDGDTVVLEDGREVRLTGIQAPKLPLGRPDFPIWPLAENAKRAMETLATAQTLDLRVDGNDQDRYRRVLAHLVRPDGVWLQGQMIEMGLARVYTFSDNRRLADALLRLEHDARQARKGIWALPYYAIRSSDPDKLSRDFGTFQVVEGKVLNVARVRNRTYVNFGDDYRTDFTLSIDRSARPLFDEASLDLSSLEGRVIRVRGWVKDFNGPLIDITHPEQIEILLQ